MATTSGQLDAIAKKVETGERLSAADGEFLFRPDVDLHAVGELANCIRRRCSGNAAYYNTNAHINPTNVCQYRCPLCAYSCDPGDDRAYVLGDDEILARAQEAAEQGCTELHIVGGMHPHKDFAWYLHIVQLLHDAFGHLHLKAYTPVEITWFAQRSSQSVEAVLQQLMGAGLGSLPGGGAEIFSARVRRQVSPDKADAETWLAVHRIAHRLGLHSNATMLYGHVETPAERVDHLLRLRALQDETAGFQAFVPLSFHPENTQLAHVTKASSLTDLRVIAVSRLLLDNFAHIKAYWVSLGVGTAQIALAYGADDLDGTVRHEEVHHQAGATSPTVLNCQELQSLITEAGFEPVERDSLYQRVRRVVASD